MTQTDPRVVRMLGRAYDELQEDKGDEGRARREFVFHMTDWIGDLHELAALYDDPDRYREDASKIVAGFLYHVIPHLRAAGRLALDQIPNAFEEGPQRHKETEEDAI